MAGDSERSDEDDARAYFAEHGHWPDDVPARQGANAPRPD